MARRTTKKAEVKPAVETKEVQVKESVKQTEVKPAQKAIETRKDSTKALETRAGVLKDADTKKPARKRTVTRKKAEVKTEMYFQFSGKEYTQKELFQKVKDIWTKELKNKVADLKEVNVYVKAEEHAAYYVINGETTGKIEL
ncbi:MAG: DUF6465 family protein [Lachnospiraceae bacterium]